MDPVVIALGLGGILFFWSRSKKKKNGNGGLPDGGTLPDDTEPGGGGKPSGGGGAGGGKIDAPQFPYSQAEAIKMEKRFGDTWVNVFSDTMLSVDGDFDKAKNIQGIPKNRSPSSWYTDEVMYAMYKNLGRKWPSDSRRGKNWKPYEDSWKRTHDYLKGHSIMNRP